MVGGGLQDFSVRSSPLETDRGFELIGTKWGAVGLGFRD